MKIEPCGVSVRKTDNHGQSSLPIEDIDDGFVVRTLLEWVKTRELVRIAISGTVDNEQTTLDLLLSEDSRRLTTNQTEQTVTIVAKITRGQQKELSHPETAAISV